VWRLDVPTAPMGWSSHEYSRVRHTSQQLADRRKSLRVRREAASADGVRGGVSSTGPIPSDLYGKFTWKIENFSEISKRELRSNVFEVGSYKWCALSLSRSSPPLPHREALSTGVTPGALRSP
jgi:hypothetical protein